MHWMLVIAVFVLLFGSRKLPDTAKAVGQSLRIFKRETSKLHDEDDAVNGRQSATVTPAQVAPATSDVEDRLRALEEENARLRATSGN
ncbi:Sec-independent protein translocase subunit TatA [Microbispora sp. NBC_01389]|uniref:Sec-independent protein translocase subunit TatA n=2 Tax=unclassified Microbispora TaxID=2614687 RepID=UPI003869F27A